MKKIKQHIIYASILTSTFAFADANLVCKGTLISATDLTENSRKSSTINININFDENRADVMGNWGCPNLALADNLAACNSWPLIFEENEIKSFGKFKGKTIDAWYLMTLNRNSGYLEISSNMNPNENAKNFRWTMYSIKGQFICEVARRKF